MAWCRRARILSQPAARSALRVNSKGSAGQGTESTTPRSSPRLHQLALPQRRDLLHCATGHFEARLYGRRAGQGQGRRCLFRADRQDASRARSASGIAVPAASRALPDRADHSTSPMWRNRGNASTTWPAACLYGSLRSRPPASSLSMCPTRHAFEHSSSGRSATFCGRRLIRRTSAPHLPHLTTSTWFSSFICRKNPTRC